MAARKLRPMLDGSYGAKVRWAFSLLSRDLTNPGAGPASGRSIVAGTLRGSDEVAALREAGGLRLADAAESIAIARVRDTLYVTGSDEQGLMYALLEVSDQLRAGTGLDRITESSESPDTRFRGIFTFLHNADCERDWFYSTDHWERYFELLARSRYNSFQIVMGHQTAYLAPPFPFFVDVPEHPEVSVPGLSADERARNLAMLNTIAELAGARGLEFVLGVWEVIAWKPQTGHGTHTQRSMVDGLDWTNLEQYTYLATRRLLAECPGIRGIQVRVNPESGVPEDRQTAFFSKTIFRALKESDGGQFLDLRGWLAHPETIEAAKSAGIPMRLSMKYWAEHLGAPYQAAEQNPAYSYADFLRKPERCPVSYQVWALGSHRHFVWGDPRYVRTFCRSLTLGDAIGFEICPPLAQKGYGNEPGSWRVLAPEYEYYTWEWERYWLYHLLFGRLTYNRASSADVWMRELRKRFGELAPIVLETYATASRVVSYLIRFTMSDPNMYIWPEADTGGLLDFLIATPPSDPAVMKSFARAAGERMTGILTGGTGPAEASAYLREVGTRCGELVSRIREAIDSDADSDADSDGGVPARKELRSTLIDAEALGELALYHAEKILAGESLALSYAGGGSWPLEEASTRLSAATPHWHRLASVTDGVYTDRQVTGPIDSGHWKDKLVLVREDEERLSERLAIDRRYAGAIRAFDFGGVPDGVWSPSRIREMDRCYIERGFVGVDAHHRFGPAENGWTYGWSRDLPNRSATAPGARFCDWHTDSLFRDTMKPSRFERLTPFTDELYRDYVGGDGPATFRISLSAGRYELILAFCDRSVSPADHGPFSVRVEGVDVVKRLRVGVGERHEIREIVEVGRANLTVAFMCDDGADWFVSALVVRSLDPVIAHVPVWTVVRGEEVVFRASVACPDRIEQLAVHVRPARVCGERSAGGHDREPVTCAMGVVEAGRRYESRMDLSTIGGAGVDRYEYWFTARSATGRSGRLEGPPGTSGRFTLTMVEPGLPSPSIEHSPVATSEAGRPIRINAEVSSGSELRSVRLHYRYVNQYYEWRVVEMDGGGSSWQAEIPAGYVIPDWDVMYYLEATDCAGRASLAPAGDWTVTIPYWVTRVT